MTRPPMTTWDMDTKASRTTEAIVQNGSTDPTAKKSMATTMTKMKKKKTTMATNTSMTMSMTTNMSTMLTKTSGMLFMHFLELLFLLFKYCSSSIY